MKNFINELNPVENAIKPLNNIFFVNENCVQHDVHDNCCLHKNQLNQAIESYVNDETFFYSRLMSDDPDINIIRIGEIQMREHVDFIGEWAYPSGMYYLKFTVFYEKKK